MGHELRTLNAKSESGSWIRRMTLGHELMGVNAMNDFVSWMR